MRRNSLANLFLLLAIFCADVTGCEEREFQCLNGQCIRTRNFVCDGFFNCDDKSDEYGCSECDPPYLNARHQFEKIKSYLVVFLAACTSDQYSCVDAFCLDADKFCNGIPDCPSADDETSGCGISTNHRVFYVLTSCHIILCCRLFEWRVSAMRRNG